MPKVSEEPVYIGCELLVRKGDSILLGLRKNCYGAGTWGLPGGHLEFGEGLAQAACREAAEEVGAVITPAELQLVSVLDNVNLAENMHHVHMSFELLEPTWEPRNMEPERCDEWRYFPLSKLPDNLFPPHIGIIANYRSQRLYQA